MTEVTDAQLLDELRALIMAGRACLVIDANKLNHMDSPVGIQAELNRWFALLFFATVVAAWLGGWIAGAVALLASVAVWFAYVRNDLRRRIESRVRETALRDVQTWRRLWRFGGVRLVCGDSICAAPRDNWMQFVRDHRVAT